MEDIKFGVVKKIAEARFKRANFKNISKFDSVSPPSIFIGSKLRYPEMNVGILSPLEREEDAWLYDSEKYWADNNFEIKDVIGLRDNLLNSRFRAKATDSRMTKGFVNIAQEIAIASNPVDIELELKTKIHGGKIRDKVVLQQGMKAPLKNAKITSNVKVHRKLDYVMNDEIKANKGIELLYKKNFDEYSLNKILSVGVLGLKKDKRLVPTRWSITATDDTIGKFLLKNIRDYKWVEDYKLFFGTFMGNHYLVFMFPGVWSYELFELYYPGSSWNPTDSMKASTDMEWFKGRTNYAKNTAGGYYAARLPIVEYLNSIKRQASVIAIRLETPSYWAALGVWVVRESLKKTMAMGGMKFDSKEELIMGARQVGKIKYDFDCEPIIARSKLLESIGIQRRLQDYF